MNLKRRILVVDDEHDVIDLLRVHLVREGYDVKVALSGNEGLRLALEESFDLALIDWMLPDVTGPEICSQVKARFPVILITARKDASDVVAGFEAGAVDFVTKPFDIQILLARVRSHLRSTTRQLPSAPIYRLGDLKLDTASHKVTCLGESVRLTLSEFKILETLLEQDGKPVSRHALLSLLSSGAEQVTPRAIDNHVLELRKKLGPYAVLIQSARSIGYRAELPK